MRKIIFVCLLLISCCAFAISRNYCNGNHVTTAASKQEKPKKATSCIIDMAMFPQFSL